jgi:hypothetical protein
MNRRLVADARREYQESKRIYRAAPNHATLDDLQVARQCYEVSRQYNVGDLWLRFISFLLDRMTPVRRREAAIKVYDAFGYILTVLLWVPMLILLVIAVSIAIAWFYVCAFVRGDRHVQ